MRKHACRKPYVSHLFCYFSVNPSVVRTVCRSTADSLDRYFHTSLSLATSSAAAAAAQKKYTSAHNSSLPKNTRGPLFNAGRRRGLHKRFFCANCCVYVKNKCVSCYYSGIVRRRHCTKPESLPVRSTFSFFFSPTVIRDPRCFDEFCLMRATPPVRLR